MQQKKIRKLIASKTSDISGNVTFVYGPSSYGVCNSTKLPGYKFSLRG